MPKNENTIKKSHDIIIRERKFLKATGVLDVEEFDESKVFAMLEGIAMTVCGKNLHVSAFSTESGELNIEGEISSVTYSDALSKKAGFFARIFR